jgi:N-acetylglucosamine-6-phosphate deacetylase
MKKIFKDCQIFTGQNTKALQNQAIIVENGLVIDVIDEQFIDSTVPCQNLGGANIAPAFIDLQIYGGNGSLFNTEISEATIAKTVAEQQLFGTAQLQITLSTMPLSAMIQSIEVCQQYKANKQQGLLGLHLEGPYFSAEKRGAHLAQYVRKATLAELQQLISLSQGLQTYMTIAPEQMDDACLKLLLDSHIHLSLGHSSATYTQAKAAFAKGIPSVTHLFNAMTQFQSREPGIVGAAYDSGAWASIIADGIHCDFASVRISKRMMGERLFLITDAVTEDTRGEYSFRKAGDRYVNDQGILSGSALNMMQAVKNCVEKANIPIDEALRMASTYPAQVVGMGAYLGKIAKGYRADFVVFDQHLEVINTIIA